MFAKIGHKSSSGFTLIELLVTIAVVAVLMMIAAPSFQNYTANQRVRSTSADLLAAMNYARSEAVKRNATVTVDYDGTDWINGWDVVRGGDTLLSYDAQSGVTITASASNDITYGRDGRLTSAAVAFTVTENPNISAVDSRCVRITLSGKPAVTKGAC